MLVGEVSPEPVLGRRQDAARVRGKSNELNIHLFITAVSSSNACSLTVTTSTRPAGTRMQFDAYQLTATLVFMHFINSSNSE
eukprot:COSAG02_NODE_2277_length_9240_cov_4.345914_9_plen_82_part_00